MNQYNANIDNNEQEGNYTLLNILLGLLNNYKKITHN
jgi:hypothetical protein